MRRLRMVAMSVVFGGTVAGTLALGGGSVLAQGIPAPTSPSPGYSQANTQGSCRGSFGDYEAIFATSGPLVPGFSQLAPVGTFLGQFYAVGGCINQGIPAPTFPPG